LCSFSTAIGFAFSGQDIDEGRSFEAAPERTALARRANRDMIIVPPEADLVARLDPEFVSQRLWDDNLTLGADAVSHTYEYNLATHSLLPATEPRIEAE
jgi:hypothetical protein